MSTLGTFIRSLRRRTGTNLHFLSQWPSRAFFGLPAAGAIGSPGEALTLSPFFAALRLYQTTLGSLPLVTYRTQDGGGWKPAESLPVYDLLNTRPNPAMSRAALMEHAVYEMFLGKGSFWHVRKNGDGLLTGLYPIPSWAVVQIVVDAEWNKLYQVSYAGVSEWYTDAEIAHVFLFSLDGVSGCNLLSYAGEALGLHKQVQRSAGGYFANAVRPAGYLKFPGKLTPEAVAELKAYFKSEYAGPDNAGRLPILTGGGEFTELPNTTPADARVLEAMGASVADVSRWTNVSPLLLHDLSRGTYSNLAADNSAFYQRTVRPLLEKIELELNWKVFGRGSRLFARFDVRELLRGDPVQQATVAGMGIKDGWYLRSEQRAAVDLPPVAGLDVPLAPLNMAPPGGPVTPPEKPTDGTGTAVAPAGG